MTSATETARPLAATAMEEHLRREIAYYKARLADMRNAPPHSRHREGMVWASTQLESLEWQLSELLGCTRAEVGQQPHH